MAIIKCPECGKELSDKAPACPHCGCPMVDIRAQLDSIKQSQAYEAAVKEAEIRAKANAAIARKQEKIARNASRTPKEKAIAIFLIILSVVVFGGLAILWCRK